MIRIATATASRDPRSARLRSVAWSLCALLAGMPLASAGNANASGPPALSRFERQEPHMGTMTRIVVYAADRAAAERAMAAGFERIAALDQALSDYREDSELTRLAARAGQGPVVVSADLFGVLQASQSLSIRSDGAFDATSGTLTRLWRGARRLSELPAEERIEQARALCGYRHLHLDADARTAMLDLRGMQLDLGGIAKGYAADEALGAIGRSGVASALVALGGDIAVSDAPPGMPGWRIEVAPLPLPGVADRAPAVLHLRHAAVSTAGDAEQWMDVDGRRYSHILDPRNGQPMPGRSSTTVIARSGLEADGLDTTAALLGPEAGTRLVDAVPGAAMRMEHELAGTGIRLRASARWPRTADRVYDGNGTAVADVAPALPVRSR